LQDAGILTTATIKERRAVRALCEANHIDFCRFFFRNTFGEKFLVGPHHGLIEEAVIDPILNMELDPPRVIINIPPGFTKTMEVVIMLISRALARFPDARFIHTSFSDTLVEDNSTQTRDIILSQEYQALWPTEIRKDVGKKGLWRTHKHGGMLAAPAKGTITGFRAGRLDKKRFTGALIIDDPLKPDDAHKKAEREAVNRRFNTTMRNRLAHEGVPIIVIMQRLHQDDLSGFLLKGGSGDYWHHLNLAVTVDHGREYPAEYTHGIPIEHNLPEGPLWREKFNEQQIKILMADPYVFNSQYMQDPIAAGGACFTRDGFRYWNEDADLPTLEYRVIYGDTAQKDKEQHDYSVFQCWGKGVNGNIYLLDQMRGKWKAPELESNARTFWGKHKVINRDNNLKLGNLRCMKIEDKASGTGLIQSLQVGGPGKVAIPVEPIPRERDKYTRGMDAAPAFNSGLVYLPRKAQWLGAYESELLAFPGGTFDDQVDPTMDAISDMIGKGLGMLGVL
jgi:predicted phage terminase large subunit-like protein